MPTIRIKFEGNIYSVEVTTNPRSSGGNTVKKAMKRTMRQKQTTRRNEHSAMNTR